MHLEGRSSRVVVILDVALLRQRFQPCCGLGLNQNLPFVNKEYPSSQKDIFRFNKKEVSMKKEDIWMIIVVVFAIVWTASFGWGVFG